MPLSRRHFVRTAALTTAAYSFTGLPAFARTPRRRVAPSDRVRFGAIGVKGMGWSNATSFLKIDGFSCVALCDVDASVLAERTQDAEKLQGSRPEGYGDYRRLLERTDLDFVIVGTPDHWHPLVTLDALASGKHVYCEKPMANSIGEADLMLAGAQRSGKLVQIGQWQRSGPHWRHAMEYVHSGALGRIRTVKTWAYQGWMKPVPVKPDEPVPEGVDYDMWLGPAPARPFNRNRFHFNFRWFWDYAGGLMTDWGVHILDFALYGMKAGWPKSVMAIGGKFAYPDDASETPDTLQAVYEYDGFTLLWEHATGIDLGPYNRTHGVAFIGNNGTLVVDRSGWRVIAESEDDGKGDRRPKLQVPPVERLDGSDLDRHTQNFAAALRGDATLNADVAVGHKVAVTAHMGNVAFRTGRRLYWDESTRAFRDDEEANRLKSGIAYRAPWKLTVP
jgi:predicted dehydrogenase